jgi:hypothetical protein
MFDLKLLSVVYEHWNFSDDAETLLGLVSSEMIKVSKDIQKYKQSDFRDKETRDFHINQSNYTLLHLKRLKAFLEEGIDKEYKLILE